MSDFPSYPLINKKAYSHNNVSFKVNGKRCMGLKEINYKHKRDPGEARGTHPQVLGTTVGEYKAEGDITIYKADFDALILILGDGWMQAQNYLEMSYREQGMPFVTDQLFGVEFLGSDKKSSGKDPNEVKLELHIKYIIENGVKPLKDMLIG